MAAVSARGTLAHKPPRLAGFHRTGFSIRVNPMRILIVEDEKKAGAFLRKGLTESGFVADVAEDGEDGLLSALGLEYDLVILDAMLPGRDGWSVLAEIRRQGKSTPVLFLTARGAVQDRVKGLELGADDYLVKPYAFSELL